MGIINNNETTELAEKIFGINGFDQLLGDIATIWLFHYSLVKTRKASIYVLFFNEFRKTRIDFTKDQLLNYLTRMLEDADQKNIYTKTINSDITVFIRKNIRPSYKANKREIEEEYEGLLINLDLIKAYMSEIFDGQQVDWYSCESKVLLHLIIKHNFN